MGLFDRLKKAPTLEAPVCLFDTGRDRLVVIENLSIACECASLCIAACEPCTFVGSIVSDGNGAEVVVTRAGGGVAVDGSGLSLPADELTLTPHGESEPITTVPLEQVDRRHYRQVG